MQKTLAYRGHTYIISHQRILNSFSNVPQPRFYAHKMHTNTALLKTLFQREKMSEFDSIVKFFKYERDKKVHNILKE